MGFPMATDTTHLNISHQPLSARIKAAFSRFGKAILQAGEDSSRLKDIRALQAHSDAELAKMGLKRGDIPRHVYRDLFYI